MSFPIKKKKKKDFLLRPPPPHKNFIFFFKSQEKERWRKKREIKKEMREFLERLVSASPFLSWADLCGEGDGRHPLSVEGSPGGLCRDPSFLNSCLVPGRRKGVPRCWGVRHCLRGVKGLGPEEERRDLCHCGLEPQDKASARMWGLGLDLLVPKAEHRGGPPLPGCLWDHPPH